MADGADRNDADLVADVRAGDSASFTVLFDRWFGPVLGAAQDMLGDRTEAARVATDTFQSVWLHLDELADPEAFGAWVLLTSRTFARKRQAERDPSEEAPSGPLFENDDELRRAVAKVLARRQVPALAQPRPAQTAAAAEGPSGSLVGVGAAPSAAVPEAATDRVHRYHWTPADPASGVLERIRSVRISPGTVVALAIVLLGSVIWLMSRDGSSQIDGGRPAPLFSPASPTTIDGAAARGDNGAAAPGAAGVAPGSQPPDPATPAPTGIPAENAAPASSRKVKVATGVPRSVATTPARRGTTAVAPGTAAPLATVTPVSSASGPSRTDGQAPTTAPPSTTTATTARTTTTAESTTASTARTTTTRAVTTTTTADVTTTTGRITTTADVTTTTTTRAATTTTRAATTASTTSTTRATTTTTRATTTTTRVTTVTTAPPTTTTRPPSTTTPPTASGGPLV